MRMMLIAAALLAAAPATAKTADPAAPVRAAIDTAIAAFNAGDAAGFKAAHVASPTIIDEPPPYLWSGKDAFDTWLADLGKESKAAGKTEEKVTLGRTLRAEMSGSAAYVIVQATYSFVQGGVAKAEPSRMTFVMNNSKAGWKIAAWSWTGPRPSIVKAKAGAATPAAADTPK
ncbi:MAG: nuclear transport factor 2 family protein [Sphingomonadales bacterium]|jgi:ketosteroid isomerase-like protein